MSIVQWILGNYVALAVAVGGLLLAVADLLEIIPSLKDCPYESKIKAAAQFLLGFKKP